MQFKNFLETKNNNRIFALQKLVEKIKDNSQIRLHMTNHNLIVKSRGQYVAPGYYRMNGKPFGLWYALGTNWFEFILFEHPNGIGDLIYKVDINPAKILSIQNQEQVENLEKQYPNAHQTTAWGKHKEKATYKVTYQNQNGEYRTIAERPYMPNWQLIARDYWGIEIIHPEKISGYWIEDWSVPSGCIWNKNGIKNVELLAKFNLKTESYELTSSFS